MCDRNCRSPLRQRTQGEFRVSCRFLSVESGICASEGGGLSTGIPRLATPGQCITGSKWGPLSDMQADSLLNSTQLVIGVFGDLGSPPGVAWGGAESGRAWKHPNAESVSRSRKRAWG